MANVHLDATEHEDHVVFLHQIQEGPANRSFGLQVAKLAGVPDSILRAAKDKLGELESGQSQGPAPTQTELSGDATTTLRRTGGAQSVGPGRIERPRALDRIYQLKQKLDDDS